MCKKIISLFLLICSLFSINFAYAVQSFEDIEAGSFYEEAVKNLTDVGIINGYENGLFGPNDTLLRSQTAAILDRYNKLIESNKTGLASVKSQFNTFKEQKFSNKWIKLADGVEYSPFYNNEYGLYFVVFVDLKSPNITVKPITGEDIDVDGTNYLVYDRVSDMVSSSGALLGINAGFFSNNQSYGNPEETFFLDSLKRNFRPDRAAISLSAFEQKAYMGVWANEFEVPYQQNVVGAGPIIVKDGVFNFDPYDEAFSDAVKEERRYGKNARTAIGIRNNGSELIIIVGERSKFSSGMNAEELAQIFVNDFNVDRAMMFDGGSSTTFVVDEDTINMPSAGSTINVITGLGVFLNK